MCILQEKVAPIFSAVAGVIISFIALPVIVVAAWTVGTR